jgi:hypothetical protein
MQTLKELYDGIRRVNPQITAINAIRTARAWVNLGARISFYND